MSTSVQTRPTLSPALPGVTAAGEAGGTGLLAIYALTMLVSATLLFFVQPMFARMVLPLLGGSPGVWNTTVVFYQAVLLGGYCYAHAATARLGVRRQAGLHVLLLLLPLLALPIAVPAGWIPPAGETPIPWLLALLTVAVGLPFFVVSTSSPMLQRWFVSSGHPAAPDPYFLYAASNVGSMLALLSYPVLVEPSLRLTEQSWLWAAGYGLLGALTALCVLTVWRSPLTKAAPAIVSTTVADAPSGRRRLRWVMLAFVPSSLMLSVTTYLTTNIAPIPLLWVVPLALYLLTFILVFAGRQILPDRLLIRAMPIAILLLAIIMIVQASQPISLPIALNLATFFIVAMVCHGAIARDRPDSRHLTEFYIWMSVGGVLGGLLNALAAPVLFSGVAEYPIVLVLACLLMPSITPPLAPGRRWLDFGLALGLAALTAGLIFGTAALGLRSGPLGIALTFGPPVLLCFGFSRRPLRFGLGLAGLFLASMLYSSDQASVIHAERSFFGIHRVLADPGDRFHMIVHGGTVHGLQSTEPARRREPLAYYQRSGPIGQVFASFEGPRARHDVAVIGLGAGTLACYSQPGQRWTFYEIDPSVERIARDPRYFTYLQDCAPEAGVVLGDARLSLVGAPDGAYDLIVLDAYSSDTVPMHLITREALALYRQKLAPHGVLAFHISNAYLDLKPVLGNLAQDAHLICLAQDDLDLSPAEQVDGKVGSQWAVMVGDSANLGSLVADVRWKPLGGQPGAAPWTDDYSSILSVMHWH